MRSTFFSLLSVALAGAVALGAAGFAQAQNHGGGQGNGQNQPRPRDGIGQQSAQRGDNSHNSLSDSVRRVQREPGVRVLSAERVPFDGRDINRIKYVDERGRVRYMDDAGGGRRRSDTRDAQQPAQTQSPPARADNPYQP